MALTIAEKLQRQREKAKTINGTGARKANRQDE